MRKGIASFAIILLGLLAFSRYAWTSMQPVAMRLAGLILFIGGVVLNVYSRIILGSAHNTARKFSKPNRLIQHGPYRYIRHPIYSSILLMGLGFELSVASYLFFIVLVLVVVVVFFYTVKEEKKIKNWFPQYKDYQNRTKKFIPFIF